jgi:hypothetical protein
MLTANDGATMSSLIFYTDPEQALVATDTLAVTPVGAPMMFSSKAIYLPHLRTIIAGTGMGMFSGDWAMTVNNRMVLRGIQNLDYHTPAALRELWQRYKSEYPLPEEITTTVYHFGLSEDDQSLHAYAYRSTNNFSSERLCYGFGLKPACTLPDDGSLVENLPLMMAEQRNSELKKPQGERLYIGGECIALHLTKNGCNAFRVFQFEDYPQNLREIFCNHRRNIS